MKFTFIIINVFETLLFQGFRPTTIFSALLAARFIQIITIKLLPLLIILFLTTYSIVSLIVVDTNAVTQLLLPLLLFEYARRYPLTLQLNNIWLTLITTSLIVDYIINTTTSISVYKRGFMMEGNVLAYISFLLFLASFYNANLKHQYLLLLMFFITTLLLVSTGMFLMGILILVTSIFKNKRLLAMTLIGAAIILPTLIQTVVTPEIDKYVYRLNTSDHSLLTVLLSYRTLSAAEKLMEFWSLDLIQIFFGPYFWGQNLYIEMDLFAQIVKFGLIPGGLFMAYIIVIYIKYLTAVTDFQITTLLVVFAVIFLLLGHQLNRPVAMFVLGSTLAHVTRKTRGNNPQKNNITQNTEQLKYDDRY